MNRILVFLFVLCSIKYCIAQSVSPEVIGSAGNTFTNGSNQLDWTLGEPTISTFNNGSNLLTQGLHQDNLIITSIDNIENNYGFNIFPNPSIDFVQIHFENANENNVIELFTNEGKLILTQSSNFNTLSQIDMSNCGSGTYLLKIQPINSLGKSYKIVKTK